MFTLSDRPQSWATQFKDSLSLFKVSYIKIFPFMLLLTLSTTLLTPQIWHLNPKLHPWVHLGFTALLAFISFYLSTLVIIKIFSIGTDAHHKLKSELQLTNKKFLIVMLGYLIYELFIYLVAILAVILSIVIAAVILGVVYFFAHFITITTLPAFAKTWFITSLVIAGVSIITLSIYLIVPTSFCIPLIAFDNVGPIKVIKASIKLVYKRWWKTFALLLFTMFPLILWSAIYVHVLTFSKNHGLIVSLNLIVQMLLVPWGFSILLVLYNDLRLRLREDERTVIN